jgi:hypothetical protein
VLTPSNLLYATWQESSSIAGYHQQDAHEFLIAFLDGVDKHARQYHSMEAPTPEVTPPPLNILLPVPFIISTYCPVYAFFSVHAWHQAPGQGEQEHRSERGESTESTHILEDTFLLVPDAQFLPLTCHLSPVTSHLSSLTFHLSPFSSQLSPLTFYLSTFAIPRSWCTCSAALSSRTSRARPAGTAECAASPSWTSASA